jgi:hypothetical protein
LNYVTEAGLADGYFFSFSYIKELAERLNTLESQMQPPLTHQDMQYQGMNEVSSPRGYHEFSPPMDASLLGRKRTFSMSEGIHGLSMPQSALTSRSQPPTVGMLHFFKPLLFSQFSR